MPYAGSTSKKFFLGLELPNEVSEASKRPIGLLVTPPRGVGHIKMTAIPHEVLIPQVFLLLKKAFSPLVRIGDGGILRATLHGHRCLLGLKNQVYFKRG